ncbi:TetR/AcrR family transcriptional regulator [Herbidospora yilanensis]|uniref:TetR/AcrR family transcriptional regulator n=1 Tax=Herbidospora yilanensis TaxID=354426 RepID=UPI0007824FBC|nr:TetR/AcrR family transcriptional regulator [Herbidospora yilanensis]
MESLLQGATRLFAALGYDATTLKQIAEATGLDPAKEGFGGSKRDLYLAVIERASRIETEALEGVVNDMMAADQMTASAAVHEIVDRYIDFCVANPEFPALWIHRWLYDAADLTGLERQYSQPLITMTTSVLEQAAEAGYIDDTADMEYCVWTLIWCVHGFVQGGVLDESGDRLGAENPEVLARFRRHLHRLAARTLNLS